MATKIHALRNLTNAAPRGVYPMGDRIDSSPILRAGRTSTGPLTSSTDPAVIREALDAAILAGSVRRIEFEATVSFDTVNGNGMRPDPGQYADFAKTFARADKARPFLYDHLGKMAGRKGSLIESWSTKEKSGVQAMHQVIALTRPDAIIDYSEGGIDSFSIGWEPKWYECSACKADIMKCDHWPFDEVAGEPVHFITHENVGRETSAVIFPAWDGTGPDALRLVAELRGIPLGSIRVGEGETRMDKEFLKALGLPEDATAEQVIAKINELQIASANPVASLSRIAVIAGLAADAKAEDVEIAVAERFNAQIVTREEAERVRTDALRRDVRASIDAAVRDGKLTAALAVPGGWAEQYGMSNFDGLKSFLGKQGKVVPIGIEPPASTQRNPSTTTATRASDPNRPLTADERKILEMTGVSEEAFRKTLTEEAKADEALVAELTD